MVGEILPEALEDGANMVPYGKLVVKLTGGTSVLDIWPEETEIRKIAFKKPLEPQLLHKSIWGYWNNHYFSIIVIDFFNDTNTHIGTDNTK